MTQEPSNDRFGADGVILVLASILLVGSVYLLFKDIGGLDDYSKLTPVGKFASSRNDVRRKVQSGFSWGNVSEADIVYEGDSVFTGDESEANIALDNGATLTVDSKSLVVIRTQSGRVAFDLQYGSLAG